jgi:hypothetical protein
MLSRRNLITAAIGIGAAQIAGRASNLALSGDRATTSFYNLLSAFCADLRCPRTISSACLQALPVSEAAAENLASLVLADMVSASKDCSSASAIRRSIRDQSREDFSNGKIAYVDGWMLSLTETRIFALCALLEADAGSTRGATDGNVDSLS